jgi:shingomyelin synthase
LVLAKRCFLLLSLLYVYRAITMSVTVLPIASRTYYCSPKKSSNLLDVIFRALQVFSGMGLSINGQQNYCGDSIYSGHTTILFFAYLILNECEWTLRGVWNFNFGF